MWNYLHPLVDAAVSSQGINRNSTRSIVYMITDKLHADYIGETLLSAPGQERLTFLLKSSHIYPLKLISASAASHHPAQIKTYSSNKINLSSNLSTSL